MAANKKQTEEQVARFADMFSALGTEPRLRIMRLLLSAHPDGMVVGDIIAELGYHGLHAFASSGQAEERRPGEGAARKHVSVVFGECGRRCRSCLGFLYAECCTRNKAIEPQAIVSLCK